MKFNPGEEERMNECVDTLVSVMMEFITGIQKRRHPMMEKNVFDDVLVFTLFSFMETVSGIDELTDEGKTLFEYVHSRVNAQIVRREASSLLN